MAAPKRGLGRGLDALLGGTGLGADIESSDPRPRVPQDHSGSEVRDIAVEFIRPNKKQPRQDFPEEALQELSNSIKSQGVLQPILVRPLGGDDEGEFEIVAGERRWRAAMRAGLTVIPALVREMTDLESLAVALIENLQREDLNAIEEAQGYKRLLKEFGVNQEELARQMGKSRPALANSMRLLKLPAEVQEDIREGRVSAGHGRALMAIDQEEAMEALRQKILGRNISVRQAEAEAAHFREHGTLPGASSGGKSKRGSRALPEELSHLQEKISEIMDVQVKIKGDLQKGTLTFRYQGTDGLKEVANALGIKGVFEDFPQT